MKCIKINTEIVSLENVKKIYPATCHCLRIVYFNNEDATIGCENVKETLDQIFEILSKNT